MPELRDQVFPSLLTQVFESGMPYVGSETPATLARKEGPPETVYFNFVYSPFRNVDGEIEGVFVIASDVTEQVLARNQLNDLREAAESANRAKDEFLAMLGHELRNPLSPILTALQLMKLRGSDASERERTVIERQVTHLTRLVDDLLDVSRIARGKVELKEEIVEIAEIVAKAIEIASPLLEQRTHTLDVHVQRKGLTVKGDSTRLSQVVSNLLTNAAKYTPPGGHITIRTEAEATAKLSSVCGIQAWASRRTSCRGYSTSLCRSGRPSIDRKAAWAWVSPSCETWSNDMAAPCPRTVMVQGRAASSSCACRGRASDRCSRMLRPTVRVQNPWSLARMIRRRSSSSTTVWTAPRCWPTALSAKGYDTRVAHDAPVALRIAADFRPDVALLDIGLPVMDGYELAARLRELPDLNGMKLIALTGYGQESDRQKSREAGFDHHLVKPVDLLILESVLAESTQQSDDSGAA